LAALPHNHQVDRNGLIAMPTAEKITYSLAGNSNHNLKPTTSAASGLSSSIMPTVSFPLLKKLPQLLSSCIQYYPPGRQAFLHHEALRFEHFWF
jgi:hypothetical protein